MPSAKARPPSTPSQPTKPATPWRRLLLITLLVGLAHAALLGGLPATLGLVSGSTSADTPAATSFVTRMLAPDPVPTPAVVARAWGAALTLVVMILLLNLTARLIAQRSRLA